MNAKNPPTMQHDIIFANFQPSDTRLLKYSSNNQLLIDNPILSSILSKIFPYLLIVDNALEIITWTNDDPYTNMLIIIIYSLIIMYWHYISLIVFPILLSLVFSYLIWNINSTIYDIRNNEKPTIDEILRTLHNITVRFEMLLKPIKRQNMKLRNFVQLLVVTALLTPVHLLFVKFVISPQKYLWLCGLFCLSYHSPWSYSMRRLLWRSVYIRIVVFYLTGLDIKRNLQNRTKTTMTTEVTKGNTLGDFRVLNKTIESPTRLNQTVIFEVMENERRWIGLGWSHILLPHERANYCFKDSLAETTSLSSFNPPTFNNDLYIYKWEWVDDQWTIDMDYSKHKNNGWKYFDNYWENGDYVDGFSKFTRSRVWTRKAKLIIDKKSNVYDE